jgi:hypothetical protein
MAQPLRQVSPADTAVNIATHANTICHMAIILLARIIKAETCRCARVHMQLRQVSEMSVCERSSCCRCLETSIKVEGVGLMGGQDRQERNL